MIVLLHSLAISPQGKNPPVPTGQEARRGPKFFWTWTRRQKSYSCH